MTETVGFYCPKCDAKYVRHKCRDGLPCDHDKDEAIYVYAKKYKDGENVRLENKDGVIFRGDGEYFPTDLNFMRRWEEGFIPDISKEEFAKFKDAYEKRWMSLKEAKKID